MSEPLVTIGITGFREGKWLRECWHSVLAQTDPRWCAVLVLDGSADEATRQVYDSLEHPRLRKHTMPTNVGPYPVRNRAFELTTTPYHFYIDGDDQLLPESVQLVLGEFERHRHASFVYGDYQLFGARSEVQHWNPAPSWDDFVASQPIPGPCAYRTSLWEELGGFSPELARGNGDYDFLIGAVEAGHVGRHVGTVFYKHRVGHRTRVSGSYEGRYWQTAEIMVRRHPRFFADRQRALRFLAVAYRRSLEAELSSGHARSAASIAMQGLSRGLWRERHTASEALAAVGRSAVRLARHAVRRPPVA
jgi:glycosyltransferase involved in cell wall biosynthesis